MAYIVFVAIPLLNPRHCQHLPRDMAMTGLLYSIPLITIGAASVFGWMLAYLRGPAVVSDWISHGGRRRSRHDHAAAGRCCSSSSATSSTPFRRSSSSCR